MKDKARKSTTTPGSESLSAEVLELPERWSVQRKTELVLRLLRGEALERCADPRVADRRRVAPHQDLSALRALHVGVS
jgi:hypothetical protein